VQGSEALPKNREVENAAVSFVKAWYKKRGWTVTSVEAQRCDYDLHCVKQNQERYVEVKGVNVPSVILTAGEFDQAD